MLHVKIIELQHTIDLEHDKKDRNKKLNIPIQVLVGKKGSYRKTV